MFDKNKMWGKYNKRIKRPLPEYDLPRPPDPFSLAEPVKQGAPLKLKSDKECCIIFPLYEAYRGIVPHYVINSSFWAAHAWRVNTDIIEKGWDVWFFVDKRLWVPEVKEMFEKANLTDFVVLYAPPEGRVIRHDMGLDLYATTEPMFENYHRCYMVDTDLFPSIRHRKNILKTERLLNIGEDESIFMTYNYGYDPHGHRNIARQKYEFETEEEARPIYNSYVEKYLGYVPKGRWGVSGQMFVWNPQRLRQDFRDMVLELTPNISDDEEQYGVYLEKTGVVPEKLRQLWRIPIYYNREDYFTDEPHYFDHIWLERSEEDWEIWRKNPEGQEVPTILGYEDPQIKPIWTDNIGLNRRL